MLRPKSAEQEREELRSEDWLPHPTQEAQIREGLGALVCEGRAGRTQRLTTRLPPALAALAPENPAD